MTSRLRWVAALLAAAGLTAACAGPPPSATPPPANASAPRQVTVTGLARGLDPCPPAAEEDDPTDSAGERLPALELPCLGRGAAQVNLARLGGQPTLVNLWATWCGPCRKEMPALQKAYERHRGEVLFLGVDTRDDPHGAADFLEEVEVTYPQVADIDGELLAHLRIPGLPVTVMLDADGNIVAQHVGPLDADTIEDLLAQAGA